MFQRERKNGAKLLTDPVPNPSLDVARGVEQSYRLVPGLYLLGSLERGVTVYKQQVRAHNLVWSLWELDRVGERPLGRVAVIGAGIAGLTCAAGMLSRWEGAASVTVFEQLWDLCPLQQGSDARWLHPRIYNWPDDGSRAPSASLPLLNWSEGRASDVARTIVRGFSEHCQAFVKSPDSLAVILGLRHFQISAEKLEISWVGTRTEQVSGFFRLGEPEGATSKFETIIVAAGFGLERLTDAHPTPSYWRNEQLGQPVLDGTQRRYVISGYGDGAMVDLCRLTIERFRQDTIVYELFGSQLADTEARLERELADLGGGANLFNYFQSIEAEVFAKPLAQLAHRLRKDTAVVFHIRGREPGNTSLSCIFGPTSSRLNRLMAYLLYRCGAYAISFDKLDDCVRQHSAPASQVLCRYGAHTKTHLKRMIVDYPDLEAQVDAMEAGQAQTPVRRWKPGTFPITGVGNQQ